MTSTGFHSHQPTRRGSGLAYVLASAIIACGGGANSDGPTQSTVSQVTVTSPAASVEVGLTLQLSAAVQLSNGTSAPTAAVTWSSSDVAIATVTAGGLVRAVSPGRATISAVSGGKQGQIELTITRYAGTYTLATVSGVAPPVNTVSTSCITPPLTVCAIREYAAGGSIVLEADGRATFTDIRRTDIITASGTSVGTPTPRAWAGTYTASGTALTLSLASGTTQSTFLGSITEGRISMPVPQSATVSAPYVFVRP